MTKMRSLSSSSSTYHNIGISYNQQLQFLIICLINMLLFLQVATTM